MTESTFKHSSLRTLIVATALAGFMGGCRSTAPAVQRSQQAANLLVDSRQSLVTGEATVADSLQSLKTLRESKGDLRPSFELFLVQLDAVNKQAERVASEAGVVKNQNSVYCSARQSDVTTISNDDLRHAAEQRTSRMKEQCDTINDMYAQVNRSFAGYIRNLTDLKTYLATELNYGTLDAGQKWVDEALNSGEKLRGQIRALALQVDMTSNILSPIPIATTQWPNALPLTDAVAERDAK